MTAEPKRINAKINKLHFDNLNPRLPADMNRGDDETVLRWMIRKGDIIDLMASIGATGFSSAEAVLAIKKDGSLDEYEVIEGNRRLAAVKLLNEPAIAKIRTKKVQEVSKNAKHIPETIPVLVYANRHDILAYLGYRHITGVKSWGAAEKARYLKQLFDHYSAQGMEDNKVFHTISQAVATKPYYAKKTLATLALADIANEAAYWELDRLNVEDVKFAVLGTALNHKPIVKFLGIEEATDWHLESLDENRLKELFSWLFQKTTDGETVVKESRQLNSLAKVVSNEQALIALRKGRSLEYASELTDEADDVFRRSLLTALNKIELAQSQIKRIKQSSESDLEILREIWGLTKDIGVTIKARLTENKTDEPF